MCLGRWKKRFPDSVRSQYKKSRILHPNVNKRKSEISHISHIPYIPVTSTENLSKLLVCELVEYYSSSFRSLNSITSQKKNQREKYCSIMIPMKTNFITCNGCLAAFETLHKLIGQLNSGNY